MLSIGPAMAGLPFHSHGASWLGLVGGEKLWLIAKPNALPAAEHGKRLNHGSYVQNIIRLD